MKNDLLKSLLGQKGEVRFLNRAGIIALTGDLLDSALQTISAEARPTPLPLRAQSIPISPQSTPISLPVHLELPEASDMEFDEPFFEESVDTVAVAAPPDNSADANDQPTPNRPAFPSKRNKFLNLKVSKDNVEGDALDMSSRFTESAERKMQIASRVYNEVCAARNWNALDKAPSDERLLQFIYLCLHKDFGIQYGLESFRDVYVPALFRYFDREGFVYSEAIRDRIKHKIHAMVKNGELAPEQIPKERGAEPICSWDLEYIASVYPKGCRDRAQVMSWMSVGLHTGVRGVSLESAMWTDVKIVEPCIDAPHFKQVTLVFTATKGDPNWYHPVTIEGSILASSGSDPIYWLNQLLKQRNPNAELNQATIDSLAGQIFELTPGVRVAKATMSARIEAIGRYCGYPARMLTNHGLRAGFLCTALLKHAVNPEEEVNFSGVWMKCALVAGWTVDSKHMQGYCKKAFLRCIVSSRLIKGGALETGTEEIVAKIAGIGAIAKNRLTPCHFHGLSELIPDWPESTKTQLWVDKLNECIRSTISEECPDLQGRAIHGAEAHVSAKVCLQLAKINHLYKRKSSVPLATAFKEARKCVKDFMVSKFESEANPFWVADYIATEVQPIITTLALSYDFDEDRSKAMQKKREKRKRAPASATKRGTKRVAWSVEESIALCQGVLKYSGAKWAEISTDPALNQRTNVHCKDRMRVIMKQYDSSDPLDVAERFINDSNQTDD